MPYSSADPNAGLIVGMQSGLGSPQTTVGKFRFMRYLAGTKVDYSLDANSIREGGDGLDVGYTYKRKFKADGALVVNGRPETLGPLFAFIPGYASWSGASLPAVHTFNTYQASSPWATLVVQHPGSSILHYLQDTKFTGLTIDLTTGEPAKFTFPFTTITPGASSGVAVSPTNYNEDAFLYQGATFILNGALASGVSDVKIDLKLGVDELYAQNINMDTIAILKRDVDFTITRRYENPSLWSLINLGGGVAPTTSVATGDFTYYQTGNAASGNSGSIKIWCPLLSYRQETFTELDPDGKTVVESIQAVALKGATPALNITLANAHASAYTS